MRCLKVTLLTRDWSKHIPDELWSRQANIVTTIFKDGRQKVVTTINFFCEKNEKNEKCLE